VVGRECASSVAFWRLLQGRRLFGQMVKITLQTVSGIYPVVLSQLVFPLRYNTPFAAVIFCDGSSLGVNIKFIFFIPSAGAACGQCYDPFGICSTHECDSFKIFNVQ